MKAKTTKEWPRSERSELRAAKPNASIFSQQQAQQLRPGHPKPKRKQPGSERPLLQSAAGSYYHSWALT
jgi:hypothetical protein